MATNLNTKSKIFAGNIFGGTLLVTESRKIAQLLIDNVEEQEWYDQIAKENLLQKKNLKFAKRQAKLIHDRLILMKLELWKMVVNGSYETTAQALLAAAIKHNRFIGDFLLKVVKEKLRTFTNQLTMKDWLLFFNECEQIDPSISDWTESTRKKLGNIIFRMLFEARYLDEKKRIIPAFLTNELKGYLMKNNETYVLNCLEID